MAIIGESQDLGWPHGLGRGTRGTGEGEGSAYACGMAQDFEVVAGRRSLRSILETSLRLEAGEDLAHYQAERSHQGVGIDCWSHRQQAI